MTLRQPPTPALITREFTAGSPGLIPVDTQVRSAPAALFGNEVQVGGFFSGTITFTIPILAAGAHAVVGPQTVIFTGTAWPSVTAIGNAQQLFLATGIDLAQAVPGLIFTPALSPSWGGSSWATTGPRTSAPLGATVSVTAFSPGGTAQTTATFIVGAVLYGLGPT